MRLLPLTLNGCSIIFSRKFPLIGWSLRIIKLLRSELALWKWFRSPGEMLLLVTTLSKSYKNTPWNEQKCLFFNFSGCVTDLA
jgi:hypothetical protein